jgi:hypothetical protein
MPRGEKATNAGVKPHRARKIAQNMMRQGATRAAANKIAVAAMDREYSSKRSGNPRKAKQSFDEEAHDSRSGQRKTNLTTKNPSVSGARKPGAARKPDSNKRDTKATGFGGKAATGRRPRAAGSASTRHASSRQSTTGKRPPKPRAATRQRAYTSR